jgi:hypothetical protein
MMPFFPVLFGQDEGPETSEQFGVNFPLDELLRGSARFRYMERTRRRAAPRP